MHSGIWMWLRMASIFSLSSTVTRKCLILLFFLSTLNKMWNMWRSVPSASKRLAILLSAPPIPSGGSLAVSTLWVIPCHCFPTKCLKVFHNKVKQCSIPVLCCRAVAQKVNGWISCTNVLACSKTGFKCAAIALESCHKDLQIQENEKAGLFRFYVCLIYNSCMKGSLYMRTSKEYTLYFLWVFALVILTEMNMNHWNYFFGCHVF